MEGARLEREVCLSEIQGAPAHQKERPRPDQGNVQTRLEAARWMDKLLPARGHDETAARPLAMGQGQGKGHHLQEMEDAEEKGGGASEVPRPEGKERGFARVSAPENLENQAERKNALVPWEPLLQGGEERQPRVLPVRLGTRGGPPSQPRGLLPRTKEAASLIGTAVCGKPHVRWCERAGEIKPSPLYSISLRKA